MRTLAWLLAAAILAGCGSDGGGASSGAPPGGAPPGGGPPPFPPSSGWTVLAPSADSRLVYVSDSTGSDANDGLTESTAKRTISAGIGLLRTGFPDWLHLRSGDTFLNQSLGVWTKSGRSAAEPMVVTAFGASTVRPRLHTGTAHGLRSEGTAVSHLAVVGLHFFPHTYTGVEGSAGIRWMGLSENILLEDCVLEGYATNAVVQMYSGYGPKGGIRNYRFRRCQLLGAWNDAGHSQGLFGSGIDGLLLEECLFDHNGWKEGPGGAPATMFNHNTYISECDNVTLRGNLFLRAASMGNKFRSDVTGGSSGIWIEDNFYIEGEIGIGCGGNTDLAHRFENVNVRDNVLMHIGRTQPTGRSFSWYLEFSDVLGGVTEDNLFLHQPLFTNSYGIHLAGDSETDLAIRSNVFYGLKQRSLLVNIQGTKANLQISNNEFQDPLHAAYLVEHTGPFTATAYSGNTYHTSAAEGSWFRVDGVARSHAQWVAQSGETGSATGAVAYPDPGRDEASYMASMGLTPTLAAFIAEARLQSKAYWRPAFAAPALNAYVRAGFGR